MREIKFRAWDKWKNKMVEPNNGDFIGWHSPSNWKDCYEIMQFTGLLDKNGKEIYEGDIVSLCSDRMISRVEFGEGLQGEPADYMGEFIGWFLPDTIYSEPLTGDCEVIGNIFENPELVK